MPALVVKRTDFVLAPPHTALALKPVSHVGDPNLFGEGFGDLLLLIHVSWEIPELHYVHTGTWALYWFTWNGVSIPWRGPKLNGAGSM